MFFNFVAANFEKAPIFVTVNGEMIADKGKSAEEGYIILPRMWVTGEEEMNGEQCPFCLLILPLLLH